MKTGRVAFYISPIALLFATMSLAEDNHLTEIPSSKWVKELYELRALKTLDDLTDEEALSALKAVSSPYIDGTITTINYTNDAGQIYSCYTPSSLPENTNNMRECSYQELVYNEFPWLNLESPRVESISLHEQVLRSSKKPHGTSL